MFRVICVFLSLILLPTALLAQAVLPTRQVVLFKNGMAQIVRSGDIAEATTLEFHSQDMNDILKSFIAWNPEDLTLYSTGYSSAQPISVLLDRYGFDLRDPNLSLPAFLKQFRGRSVGVTASSSARSGRVVAIERRSRQKGEASFQDDLLTLLTDQQQVVSIWLSDVEGFKFDDPRLNEQLQSYLVAMSTGSGDTQRQITIYPGPTRSPVRVAYVQQFPVWKTSYRLEMQDEPRLQGWALVDNPTGEAWNAVDLTLVSGLPNSFRMNLYPPVFRDRPDVPLPLGELQPVIVAQSEFSVAEASGGVIGGRRKGIVDELSLPRSGRDLDRLSLAPGSPPSPPHFSFPEPEELSVGDYFEYRFPAPVTLQEGQSALLPFINKRLQLERLSIYQAGTSRARPSLAVKILNGTGSPLEPGPVTLLEDGRYAGEGVLGQLPRDEEGVVTYGTDYDLEVYGEVKSGESRRARIKIDSGLALISNETGETTLYQIRNKGEDARRLLLEHPRDPNLRLESEQEPRITRDFYRFVIDLAPRDSVEFPVHEIRSWDQAVEIASIDETSLALYFSGTSVPERLLSQLRDILRRKAEIANLEKRQGDLKEAIEELFQDQQRVRENLQALGRSDEEKSLRDRYVKQFDEQENRLRELRGESGDVNRRLEAARQQLNQAVLAVAWEGKLE